LKTPPAQGMKFQNLIEHLVEIQTEIELFLKIIL
jgi:hypothetical protein